MNYIIYNGIRIYKVRKMGRTCFMLKGGKRVYLNIETVKRIIDKE